jgi:class 3 adenylate cyclase/predicted ATPase
MADVERWLRDLGLAQYARTFAENDIDLDVAADLSERDLAELGVSLGHRRKLLRAIAALAAASGRSASGGWTAAVSAARAEAERRQLTVLFVDLVGSTGLDPEDMGAAIRPYHETCTEVVKRWEGHVAQYRGDAVLAYFGWPQAHEDDPERAVRAGLDLTARIARLTGSDGAPLAARVGIATGLVMVGDLIGEGAAQEETVVGETPNLAARLRALAGPGTVVIAPSTRHLLGGLFELDDLGAHHLKGFAAPVQAWRAVTAGPAESRFDALHGSRLTPLVGREEELSLLLERWQRAKEGDGQVVLLSGEPGIGKSRIVRALRERLAGEAYTPLSLYCSPHHVASALHPIIDMLERAAALERGDGAETKLDKLQRLLAPSTSQSAEVVPLLAALLGVPVGTRYPPLDLTPQRQKQRTLELLIDQVEGLAARQPIFALHEDVHWADPTTLELIGLLVERVRRLPVLALVTFRPDFDPPWASQPHVTQLALNRLGQRHCSAMIDRLTGGKALPEQVVEEILAKTDGVPLFVEELTKSILESDLLCDAGERYALTGPLSVLAIPSTLQDSLMARLDRLAPVREVAQVAACLGREFDYRLLAAVAPLPEPELTRAIDRLVGAELLFRRGLPPDASYSFKHALVRDAAYASLLKSRRRQHHARIVRVLQQQFPEVAASEPELLAQHFAEAGLIEESTDYWHAAGQHAIARSAMEEASTHAAKGLELLQGLAASPSRWDRELNLQLALANALNATKGHGTHAVREAYVRAVALAKQLEDTARLFPALDGLITCHFSRAELVTADELAQEFLGLAERSGDVAPQLIALSEIGIVRLALGDLAGARQSLEHALELYDPARHESLRLTYSFDPRVICLGYLAWALFALGHPAQAWQCSRESIAEARGSSHPMTLAFALGRSAALLHLCRDWQGLEATATELLALADERALRIYQDVARFYLGWGQVRSGRADEGLALLREALTDLRAGGDEDWLPHSLSVFAEAHHQAGQTRTGLELLEEASDRVASNGERWFEAEVHRLRGELLLSLGETVEAEHCFVRAATVAREQDAKMWQLRAAMSLARLWAEQDRRFEAGDLLAPVCAWFTDGFEIADLEDARALLYDLRMTARAPLA